MRLLDLFCGAGGAAMGYSRAGFEVVGVDIAPQPRYPFEFHQADALTYPLDGFDAIHASPPCQTHTRAGHLMTALQQSQREPSLVPQTRERLVLSGIPWVLENVPGAPVEGVFLCGSSFGLSARRHRIFESPLLLLGYPCQHRDQGKPVGVYHRLGSVQRGQTRNPKDKRDIVIGGTTAKDMDEARRALGIDWMATFAEIKEAIPPAYTELVGHQLMAHLERAAA